MEESSLMGALAAAPAEVRRVGITVHTSSVFANGCIQNAYLLKLCLEAGGLRVDLLSVTEGGVFDADGSPILSMNDSTFSYGAYAAIIGGTRQLTNVQSDALRAAGGRVIDFDCGPSFALHVDELLGKPKSGFFVGDAASTADVAWLIEPFRALRGYLAAVKRHPVVLVPHLWSPAVLRAKAGDEGLERMRYEPRPADTRKLEVIVMEPNIGWTKTALLPLIACDVLNARLQGDLVAVHIFGAPDGMFERVIRHLRVAPKVRTYPRLPATYVFGQFAKRRDTHAAVLCHQVDHPRNYVYYEALYFAFPLVHNSPTLDDCGYAYDGYDVDAAAGALACIAQGLPPHQGFERHEAAVLELMRKLDPLDADNIATFQKLLDAN